MTEMQPIILKGVQLAYARAIAAIELKFYKNSHVAPEEGEEDTVHQTAQQIIYQLETDGDLRSYQMWRQRVPLADLYDFSEEERNLLLDLAEAGGVQITRSHDRRFTKLGCGMGGKKAVMESIQQRWKVELTSRGQALVTTWQAQEQAAVMLRDMDS